VIETVESDVLVIGGGGAGARAALEAHQSGAKVTIVVKGLFALSGARGAGTTGFRGGRPLHLFSRPKQVSVSENGSLYYPNIPLKTDEEQDIYFKRAIQAGLGMADRKLTKIMVEEARATKHALERWGVIYNKSQYIASLIQPMPGLGCIIRTISEIQLIEETMAAGLLIQDNACLGAIGINENTGQVSIIKAKSTILAAGGNAQLYALSIPPSCVTGDGYAMGYEAGAELINMEYGQAFVTTVYPTINTLLLLPWNLHPTILNKNMDEFIFHYLPEGTTLEECLRHKLRHGPFSARDISKYVEIAMVKETLAGRANDNGGFCIDRVTPYGGIGEVTGPENLWLQYKGIDLRKKYLDINVSFQCSNGGLKIDENGQTTIEGLYAVGENATGSHGADRLGGSMMTFSQVFGARAGKHAAARAKTIKTAPEVKTETSSACFEKINKLKNSKAKTKPSKLLRALQNSAWKNLLVVRSDNSLNNILKDIQYLQEKISDNILVENVSDLITALELTNLLQVGEIVARSALARTESRGSHYREDYVARDDIKWLRSIRVKKSGGEMKLDTVKLDKDWQDIPEGFDGLWWG
jgi:fumarate reductase (CoM/CoB) subunit A